MAISRAYNQLARVFVLTSTGFGDIVPRAPIAQSLTVAEEIIGILFVAILVARLAGIYPPREGAG
jgi:hypothetical protein